MYYLFSVCHILLFFSFLHYCLFWVFNYFFVVSFDSFLISFSVYFSVIFIKITLGITVNLFNLWKSILGYYSFNFSCMQKFCSCTLSPFSFISLVSQITYLYTVFIKIRFVITVYCICLLNHNWKKNRNPEYSNTGLCVYLCDYLYQYSISSYDFRLLSSVLLFLPEGLSLAFVKE